MIQLGFTAAEHISFSAALTALTTAGLGCFVLFRNHRLSLYRVFAIYSFAISYWSACLALHVFTDNRSLALITGKYLHLGAALIPVLFVHFVTEFFASPRVKLTRCFLGVLYGVAAILAYQCVTGVLVSDVAPKYDIPYLMIANPGYAYLVAYFVFCAMCGLAMLFRGYRRAEGSRKNQIKYLLFGSLFGYAGGLDNFLFLYDITIFPLFPYGTYAIPVYVSSTAYAIAQYRLLDINVVVKKSLIYGPLAIASPCSLLRSGNLGTANGIR